MPRKSLRSVLLICAFSTVCMCFQSNLFEVVGRVLQHRQQRFRLVRTALLEFEEKAEPYRASKDSLGAMVNGWVVTFNGKKTIGLNRFIVSL